MDFLKIPFAKSTREFLTKHQNIIFLNDDDTLYFIISALNQLNIDYIRNKILLKVLPLKV